MPVTPPPNSGVYIISNSANGKQYVGSSIALMRRKRDHWYQLGKGVHPNAHLQSSWTLYGSGSFEFTVLEYCEPETLVDREEWWMTLFDSRNTRKGYNLAKADRSEWTEEIRNKISASRKGKCLGDQNPARRSDVKEKLSGINNHFFGKSHTADTKAKMASSRLGKKASPETKDKMSASLKGNPNLGWAKGKPWTEARRAAQLERGKSNSGHTAYI